MSSRIISQAVIDRALGRKRSKFNVRTDAVGKLRRTLDGRLYASAAERDYAAELEIKRKARVIVHWEPQVCYPLSVNGEIIGSHVVDFMVTMDGRDEVHEVKGHQTDLWRWKVKHFKAQYPHIPYVVIPASGLARRAR